MNTIIAQELMVFQATVSLVNRVPIGDRILETLTKIPSQALHGLAPKCKLINIHELINKPRNDYVTMLPCENGANVNNKR